MWQILRQNPRAFYWSLALHVFFALLFFVGVQIERPITEAGSKPRVVQATIVSDAALEAMVAEFEAEQARRPAGPRISSQNTSEAQEPPDAAMLEDLSAADAARLETERLEAEAVEAERQADAEREEAQPLAEAARAAAEAERLAAEAAAQAEAEQRAEAQRRAEAARRAEAERLAAEAAAAKAEAERRAEEKRLAAEAAARAEAQRRSEAARAEDERRARAEAERRAEIERRAEAQRQADAAAALARQRQLEEEARLMAEIEEQRLVEELAQERIEQEAKRMAEEDERRLAAEEAQRAREGDLLSALASEQLAREADRYVPVIRDRVRQFWVRPPATGRDLATVVSVRLIPGGDVVPNSVRVVQSSGNTAFDQSVVAAVNQASPLPVPSGPVFERFREFNFTFRP
jgi:colicin import membrane protein